jgi:hypothetical protein
MFTIAKCNVEDRAVHYIIAANQFEVKKTTIKIFVLVYGLIHA